MNPASVMQSFVGSIEKLKRWRGALSKVAAVTIIALMVYWAWQNRTLIAQAFITLGIANSISMLVWLTLAFLISLCAFVLLVRGLGYKFSFADGYFCINLSQVAAMLPGTVWGMIGLAGLLWDKGVAKRDSVFIIFLNMVISLSACAILAITSLGATWGCIYAGVIFAPIVGLLFARNWLNVLRQHFFSDSRSLPTTSDLIRVALVSLFGWLVESACFVWFVLSQSPSTTAVSPFLLASAYAASYIVGYLTLIAPAGLGAREGMLVAILGSQMGTANIFALAVVFRIMQTVAQWLNIFIALVLVSKQTWRSKNQRNA